MRPTDVEELEVHRGERSIGRLRRTKAGAEFVYDDAIAADDASAALAWSLPPSRRRIETRGFNLHPFFAGLLPEGLRLTALVRRTKTSEDDLFSLLAAVGADCIGDVWVAPSGSEPAAPEPAFDLSHPERLDFDEILQTSLTAADRERGVSGVQEKVSGALVSIPLRSAGASKAYILKLDPPDRPLLVENEAFFMEMARDCIHAAAETRLVHDAHDRSGLLVTRFDRVPLGERGRFRRVHQEDACQLLERYPADKYRITCKEIAEVLEEIATAPLVQILRFLELQAFNYLIGNGDFHAKNLSLWQSPATQLIELTPAYEVLSTKAYRGLDQRMPLKLDGRDDHFRAASFIAFATRHGVKEPAVRSMLDRLVRRATPWLDELSRVPWSPKDRDRIARAMRARIVALTP